MVGRLARVMLAALFAFSAASVASAQVGEEEETAGFAMTGVIKAIDVEAGTITLEGANDEGGTFRVDPKAKLQNGGETIALGDLEVGWSVAIDGSLRGAMDPQKVVTYLEVVDAP